jgi:hypothetical protein
LKTPIDIEDAIKEICSFIPKQGTKEHGKKLHREVSKEEVQNTIFDIYLE